MFEKQLILENIGSGGAVVDKIKAAIANNPGLALSLGGAAAGAAGAELSGATDRWQDDAQHNLSVFNDNLGTRLAPDQGVDPSAFKQYVSNYVGANDIDTTTGEKGKFFDGDLLSGIGLGNSDAEDRNEMHKLDAMDTAERGPGNSRFGTGAKEGIVDGYKIDPRLSPEDNHKLYLKQVTAGQIDPKDEPKLLAQNRELRQEKATLNGKLEDAKRNAILSYGLGGAALGAGANFARRKMQETQGR
jgi:hypothetical protein